MDVEDQTFWDKLQWVQLSCITGAQRANCKAVLLKLSWTCSPDMLTLACHPDANIILADAYMSM